MPLGIATMLQSWSTFFLLGFWRKLDVNAQYLRQTIKNKGQCHFDFHFCVDFILHY